MTAEEQKLDTMKMTELCAEERPREKLLSLGPDALSTGELLAIIIKCGTGDASALEVAQKLLSSAGGSLGAVYAMGEAQMRTIPGIGPCKAAEILASLELGRRFLAERSSGARKPVTGPRDVAELMTPVLKGLRHEECWVVLVNNANYIVGKSRLTSGGLDSTVIDVRLTVRLALEKNATGIILVHNHPSGNPRPSKADISYTEKLREATLPFDISLLDHVVICDESCYSFADDYIYHLHD